MKAGWRHRPDIVARMIVSHRHGFIFLKTKKTAGTSLEILLAGICGPLDIITPIALDDELIRLETGNRGPQNWGSFKAKLDEESIRSSEDRGLTSPDFDFRPMFSNHEPAARIRAKVGDTIWGSYWKFTLDRNPWDMAVSQFHYSRRYVDEADVPGFRSWLPRKFRGNHHIYLDEDGALSVDRLYCYENIDLMLSDIATVTGADLPESLPYRAKGGIRPSRDYRDYYDDSSQAFVAEAAEPAIRLLGYEF